MSTENMFDNTMQIYLNENGSVKETVDTSFFVANSSEVNSIQCIVPVVMNVNKVNISFKRSDGIIISNRVMLSKGVSPTDESLVVYEYTFTHDDRILTIGGNLEISLKVEYITEDNRKVWATPIVGAYVRHNIDTNPDISTAEAIYQEVDNLTEELQANINTANTNISILRIDVADLQGETEELQIVDKNILAKIESLEEADNTLSERISDEKQNLKEELIGNTSDNSNLDTINAAKNFTNEVKTELQANINTISSNLDNKKLNKIFNDIAIANNLGDNDYFVINSGDVVYRIPYGKIRELLDSGGVENHYKGDFLTYEALIEEVPIGKPGDYAFVNVGTEMVMYVWDSSGLDETYQGIWRETSTGQYVLSTTFANLQQNLLNGSFIVDTSKNYDNGDNTKTNIKDKFDNINSKITILEENAVITIDLGVINPEDTSSITITNSDWDLIKNKNVKLKATLYLLDGNLIMEIFLKKVSIVTTNNQIYEVVFSGEVTNFVTTYVTATINSDLQVIISTTTYAIPKVDLFANDTNLQVAISDGDTEHFSEYVDLQPIIQNLIDNNDMYIVDFNSIKNDSIFLDLILQEKFKKIIIKSSTATDSFLYFYFTYKKLLSSNTNQSNPLDNYDQIAIMFTGFENSLNFNSNSSTIISSSLNVKYQDIIIIYKKYSNKIVIQYVNLRYNYSNFSENSFEIKSNYIYPKYATLTEAKKGEDTFKMINSQILNNYVSFIIEPINVDILGIKTDMNTMAEKINDLENDTTNNFVREKIIITNDNYTNYITVSKSNSIVTFLINGIDNKIVDIDFGTAWNNFFEEVSNRLSGTVEYKAIFKIGENCSNSEITFFNTDSTNWESSSRDWFAGINFEFGSRYCVNFSNLVNVVENVYQDIKIDNCTNFKLNDETENSIFFLPNSELSVVGTVFNYYVYHLKISDDNKNVEFFISLNKQEI